LETDPWRTHNGMWKQNLVAGKGGRKPKEPRGISKKSTAAAEDRLTVEKNDRKGNSKNPVKYQNGVGIENRGRRKQEEA